MMPMKIQLFYPTTPFLPNHEKRRSNEDRGIGANEDTDGHEERKVARGRGAVEEDHQQDENDGEGGVDRAREGLGETATNRLGEVNPDVLFQIFPNPV